MELEIYNVHPKTNKQTSDYYSVALVTDFSLFVRLPTHSILNIYFFQLFGELILA